MFNKTLVFHQTQREYVPYEKTVAEIKAPTDESIKLYDEIKEKAYKSILDTISINNNSVNIKGIIYKDICAFGVVCAYSITINGKEITGKIKRNDYGLDDKHSIVIDIYKKLSEHIAEQLIKSVGPW